MRAITDNAEVVIFLKGTDGRYLFVNRLYEKLFHVTDAAIQGKTDYDIFPREMAEAFCRNDEVVVQTKQPFEIEERVPHDDGIHTYISIKFPLQRSSGEIYAVCGIATDITARKQAEEALRERVKELDCLYGIAAVIETEDNLERAFQRIVELMPHCHGHPPATRRTSPLPAPLPTPAAALDALHLTPQPA